MKRLLEKLCPSLGKKVAFAVVVVLLAAGGGFVYFAQRTGYTILDQEVATKAHGVTDLMSGILNHVMLEGRHEHLQHALAAATTSPDIIDVFLLKTNGEVVLGAKTGRGDERFPVGRFRDVFGTAREKMISAREGDTLVEYVITPIPKRSECTTCHTNSDETFRGYFAMKISMNDVYAAALQHRNTNILMTVLVFGGLGIVIFMAFSVLVIKPVTRLHSHIRRIEVDVGELESGERTVFPLLRETEGSDEIADLCRDFNNLLQRLNDSNDRLFNLHRQQLEQADRLATTGQMAASMAHEIKNPIAGVLGALQVFDGDTPANDPRKEILAEMMIQLERITHAVNDLLSYARPTPPMFEKVCINELIHKTLSLVGAQTKGKSITVRTSLADEPAFIDADRKQLQQVLWNVVLNAMQAMDGGGILTVTSRSADSVLEIRIEDTGKGIPSDHLIKVFTPFFTTKHKGTGLGMTISKRIVEQHRGNLLVDSEVGQGTTVTIRLPQKQV